MVILSNFITIYGMEIDRANSETRSFTALYNPLRNAGLTLFSCCLQVHGVAPVRAQSEMVQDTELAEGPPSRWVCEDRVVEVTAQLKLIDLEGRADGISVKNIIKAMEPRRIVLVHGSPEATQHLEQYCAKLTFRPVVRAPRLSERVDLTSDLNMYKVTLATSLLSQVAWATCGDYEVGYVAGKMAMAAITEGGAKTGGEAEGGSGMDVDEEEATASGGGGEGGDAPIDWSLGPSEQHAPRPLLRIGQLSLSDFKQQLSKEQIHAEFRGTGKLAAGQDGAITVKQTGRKDKAGKLSISGKLSADYFQVREQMYKQYTIL